MIHDFLRHPFDDTKLALTDVSAALCAAFAGAATRE